MKCVSGFGERVRSLRIKRGISTTEFAKKLGLRSCSSTAYYEQKDVLDNLEMAKSMAEILGTSPEYLLLGAEEKPPVKVEAKSNLNSEGYHDHTAFKAMENAWMSKPVPAVKDVVDNKNGELFLVFKKLEADTAVLLEVSRDPITNHMNFTTLKDGNDTTYYINLLRMSTRSRFTKEYRKKFTVSDVSFTVVEAKIRKLLGYDSTLIVKTEALKLPQKDDPASKNFKDSVDYYNEKNRTSFEYPQGPISLETALKISKESGISLDDLCTDHSEEHIALMQISEYEEKIKKLKEKLGMEA